MASCQTSINYGAYCGLRNVYPDEPHGGGLETRVWKICFDPLCAQD